MVAKHEMASHLIRRKNLNVTQIRREVVSLLLQPGTALTQKELEKSLGNVDRVTLYRTIRVLLDKKVIHQIPIDAQTLKYKLAGEYKKNDHPHFHCSHCNHLVCMPQIQLKEQTLPEGFVVHSSQLIIEGVCASCNGLIGD